VKVLFDTNVVLDVLLERPPHAGIALRLLSMVDSGRITGFLCAASVTTIYYLDGKAVGDRAAREHVRGLLARFEIAPVDHTALAQALETDSSDYEDAVLQEAARLAGADAIVTRNPKDFGKASLPVLDPSELLSAVLAADP